jgi:copper chaperone CopZ
MRTLKPLLAAAFVGAVVLTWPVGPGWARAAEAAPPGPSTVALHVEGMTCPSCKVAVRTALKKLDGVKDAKVDVAAKSATVDYDSTRVKPRQLVDAVNRLGYEASLAPAIKSREAP